MAAVISLAVSPATANRDNYSSPFDSRILVFLFIKNNISFLIVIVPIRCLTRSLRSSTPTTAVPANCYIPFLRLSALTSTRINCVELTRVDPTQG